LEDVQDLGRRASGVSIVAFQDGKMLLLREFRMSINKAIFNLCAGMQEKGETIEECIRRELYEETGLSVKKMLKILPPSYSAVGFSDTKTYIAFVEAGGDFSDHTSDNEEISARFYSREEAKRFWKRGIFFPFPDGSIFLYRGSRAWNKNIETGG
ncbi:MAG: NUDIX hydrolase, partial [Gallintestinimicrobium sp.]